MKSIVFGKKNEILYGVDYNTKTILNEDGCTEEVPKGKPSLSKEVVKVADVEITSFEGKPYYNSGFSFWDVYGHKINISEDEEVLIEQEVFRADLGELHIFTDKVVEEIETNKEEAEGELNRATCRFNQTLIHSNEKLISYCNLHNLDPANTDCLELFKLVYPDDDYEIVDGKLVVAKKNKNKYEYITSASSLIYPANHLSNKVFANIIQN